jgi:hypothetical protein
VPPRPGSRPGWHRQLVGRASWGRPDLAQLWNELVVEEGLTESSSTFGRREVLQQLAGRLPAGAPVVWVEQAADAILTHDTDLLVTLGPTRGQLTAVDVIRRGDGRIVAADADERPATPPAGCCSPNTGPSTRPSPATHDRLAVADQAALHRLRSAGGT